MCREESAATLRLAEKGRRWSRVQRVGAQDAKRKIVHTMREREEKGIGHRVTVILILLVITVAGGHCRELDATDKMKTKSGNNACRRPRRVVIVRYDSHIER